MLNGEDQTADRPEPSLVARIKPQCLPLPRYQTPTSHLPLWLLRVERASNARGVNWGVSRLLRVFLAHLGPPQTLSGCCPPPFRGTGWADEHCCISIEGGEGEGGLTPTMADKDLAEE